MRNSASRKEATDEPELDKRTDIRAIVRATRLNGDGYYVAAFENDKPATISFLSGDKGFEKLVPVLRAHVFSPQLPIGSKARLLREVHIICSQWAGCDAYILLTGSLQMPTRRIDITPPNAPKGTRTVQIEELPVNGPQ